VPADAEVWFDGRKTNSKGVNRTFNTPPLEPGNRYCYDVIARWQENGRPVEQRSQVFVGAGGASAVDFLVPREVAAAAK
jgi:uncharacterized protein (TIGR03000 family)